MITKLKQLEDFVVRKKRNKIVVAAAHDDNVLSAIKEVYEKGFVEPILIGDKEKIIKLSNEIGLDISKINIIKELDNNKVASLAVNLIKSGEGQVLMKGIIATAELMHAVVDKEKGIRTNQIISHIEFINVEKYPKLIMITDGGMNIQPDLKQKADIIQNAVNAAHKLGYERPKVAVLSAIEVVNPAMPCTIDAAALSKMAQRGLITGCIVDGPLSMDLAINQDSLCHKKFESEVAGDADILLVPDIETGNILIKALIFLQDSNGCGVIVGTKVPIVLTSRSDERKTKYYSILMALAMC